MNDNWTDRQKKCIWSKCGKLYLNHQKKTRKCPVHDQASRWVDRSSMHKPTTAETSTSKNQRQHVHSIAPWANAKPISLLTDDNVEERSFLNIFPTGEFGFCHKQNVQRWNEQISLAKYASTRLKDADPRFVSTDYLFWTQNLLRWNRLISSVSIALRKGHNESQSGPTITDELAC